MDSHKHLQFEIDATAFSSTQQGDWQVQSYDLRTTQRDAAAPPVQVSLPPDAVLELTLSNGQRVLVAAVDAGQYWAASDLRSDSRSDPGAAAGSVLRLGPRLRTDAVGPLGAVARGGVGEWLVMGLKIFQNGQDPTHVSVLAGAVEASQLDKRSGLYRWHIERGDGQRFDKVQALSGSGQPMLMMIHGTASSTEGSFGEWVKRTPHQDQLLAAYPNQIFAFEHPTLTHSPVENAIELVKALPKGAVLHIVSHSRGGLVGELLARVNRVGTAPFTPDELARYSQRGIARQGAGWQAQVDLLQVLAGLLSTSGIRVERFVRVAGPLRGTTLASGRLDRWASVMLNLFGAGFDAAGHLLPGAEPLVQHYDDFKNFLLQVVRQRVLANVFPGLEAMMPDSPLVDLLNQPAVEIDGKVHVIAGDFDGDGLFTWLGDRLSEAFYGTATDLVVNTPSMSGGAARKGGLFQKLVKGPDVHHFSYFKRDESAQSMLAALSGNDGPFARLEEPSQDPIPRGELARILSVARSPAKPLLLVIPDTMASALHHKGQAVWLDQGVLTGQGFDGLTMGTRGIKAQGWASQSSQALMNVLATTHTLKVCFYDWRLPLEITAEVISKQIELALANTHSTQQPVRVLAMGAGGLVARLALKNHWPQFKAQAGNRLLQLGTANQGSAAMVARLMGCDLWVRAMACWKGDAHAKDSLLDILQTYPGLLAQMPLQQSGKSAVDFSGPDYFSARTWAVLDTAKPRAQPLGRQVPKASSFSRDQALAQARHTADLLAAAPCDPAVTLYLAGTASTPVAIQASANGCDIAWSDEGDGVAPWATGIPVGVPAWYLPVAHGDMADHRPAFRGIEQLLCEGKTDLIDRVPDRSRAAEVVWWQTYPTTQLGLYPRFQEVQAAALYGRSPQALPMAGMPSPKSAANRPLPFSVKVMCASLASATSPVLLGAYVRDSLRSSAKFMDGQLGGVMQTAFNLGRYPAQPGQVMVFANRTPNATPAGAIVVGLGVVGELLPGELTQALTHGLLEYARQSALPMGQATASLNPMPDQGLPVTALLVGTGSFGLTVEVGVRCLIEAMVKANQELGQSAIKAHLSQLTIIEEMENRAICAVESLNDLRQEPQFAGRFETSGRVTNGKGGFQGRAMAAGGQPGDYRVHIADVQGALRFTVITDRARNKVFTEATDQVAVNALIQSATLSTQYLPDLSRVLFELMVPNELKAAVGQLRSVMLALDQQAAQYPWELMRDSPDPDTPPLVVRVEAIRQLSTTEGDNAPPSAVGHQVLVIGDTQSGAYPLPAAQREAQQVAAAWSDHDFQVTHLDRPHALQVYTALLDGRCRFLHLAGHGVVDHGPHHQTGMVLGQDMVLDAAKIGQLSHVPEFVFLNCCHLGNMAVESGARSGKLAANLSTQLIEMGCKAVIAAGWAVDDEAASTFAQTFYQGMLAGNRFGRAVRLAREATYRLHPGSNTWGAYQAYGDERYQFPNRNTPVQAVVPYVHPSHAMADLDMVAARLLCATDEERKYYYQPWVQRIETAARHDDYQHPGVREKLGQVHRVLGDLPAALGHFQAALAGEGEGASLTVLGQLADTEVAYGAQLAVTAGSRRAGDALMKAGHDRLVQLLTFSPSASHWIKMAEYWAKRSEVLAQRGEPSQQKKCDTQRIAALQQAEQAALRPR